MIPITNDQFKELTNQKKTFVLYFTSKDCGACKQFKPFVISAEETYNKYPFFLVDVEENEKLTSFLGVASLPTTSFIVDGEEKARLYGNVGKLSLAREAARCLS